MVCFVLFSMKAEFLITGQAFVHNHAAILFSFKDDIPVSREKIINTEYRAKLLHEVTSRTELFLERRNVVEKLIFRNRKRKKKKKKNSITSKLHKCVKGIQDKSVWVK